MRIIPAFLSDDDVNVELFISCWSSSPTFFPILLSYIVKPGYLQHARKLLRRGFDAIQIPAERLIMPYRRVMLTCDEMMQMFRMMERNGMIL